jgi:DNA polymerase-3 subunit gamma/tau
MNQFKVSALKYRPKEFEDVIGQKPITDTLEKSIKTNQLAQALLFCGPRGVGKTTCARILSKKINSDTISANDFSYNIFELDAASNNSVEDIRRLNDQVRIPPQSGLYKVYIIDEAHMLSTSAFNAFLKTLEEPPKYVIFILATTEKNKILPTILSRCQIFEFKRIGLLDIKNYLIKISKENEVKYEENALQIIAEKADGALRDALSIYDQMCSFCELNLTEISISKNLNLLSRSVFIEMTNKIINKNIPEILIKLDEIIKNGFDPHQLIIGLSSHFRNLLISKDKETTKLIEVDEKARMHLINQSSKFNYEVLIKSIDLANECELKYKNSNNKRLLVELTLMKISSLHFNGEKKN